MNRVQSVYGLMASCSGLTFHFFFSVPVETTRVIYPTARGLDGYLDILDLVLIKFYNDHGLREVRESNEIPTHKSLISLRCFTRSSLNSRSNQKISHWNLVSVPDIDLVTDKEMYTIVTNCVMESSGSQPASNQTWRSSWVKIVPWFRIHLSTTDSDWCDRWLAGCCAVPCSLCAVSRSDRITSYSYSAWWYRPRERHVRSPRLTRNRYR